MTREPENGSREFALMAARLAMEKKVHNLQLLEVGQVSIVADYFLLGTGASLVQVHAICDHLVEQLKKGGYYPLRVEGYREGWWVVIDYGALVIHIFQPEAREFYDLERLWCKAPPVELEQKDSSSFSSEWQVKPGNGS